MEVVLMRSDLKYIYFQNLTLYSKIYSFIIIILIFVIILIFGFLYLREFIFVFFLKASTSQL